MLDYDGDEIAHAERVALDLSLVQEFGGDDDRCRATGRFELDAVMRTARSARPSVADRGQHDVVFGRDRLDQPWIGVLGKALLAIIVYFSERKFILQLRRCL
jgi:hypothetical protein